MLPYRDSSTARNRCRGAGWRAALVIALAIPVCYSLTLFVNLLAGYTINRVTMFALILALGLLVDDPITDVENIARLRIRQRNGGAFELNVVNIRNESILSGNGSTRLTFGIGR